MTAADDNDRRNRTIVAIRSSLMQSLWTEPEQRDHAYACTKVVTRRRERSRSEHSRNVSASASSFGIP